MTAHINRMDDIHRALALGGDIGSLRPIGLEGVTDIVGTPGDDSLAGSAGKDNFDLSAGGDDTASGGGGHDIFYMETAFSAGDSLDGGGGDDWVVLAGDYSAGVTLGAHTLTNVEELAVVNNRADIVFDDGSVAAGKTLFVTAATQVSGEYLIADGSAELDGAYSMLGGAGNDWLTGGQQSDVLQGGEGKDKLVGGDGADTLAGGLGRDVLTGGKGADTFLFISPADSLAGTADVITNLKAEDVIDLSAIDADTGQDGDQAFHIVSVYDGGRGEATLRYLPDSNVTLLALYVDFDPAVDAVIQLKGDQTGFTHFVL